MDLPQYNQNNSQERLGINAVAVAMAKAGQIWRETHMSDVGIDGQIEYVSPDGLATGRMIGVQVKSGPSYFKDSNGSWIFTPNKKHIFYWERFPMPVLIVLHDPDASKSYWCDVRQSLRGLSTSEKNTIKIPKENILQNSEINELFAGYAISGQKFMSVDDVLGYIIKRKNNNASFPVSYFDLFCFGLTNICRSLYFDMGVATTVAQKKLENINSRVGWSVSEAEHEFLFEYIKFIVHQHIADVNYSDCMVDWYDCQMQPSFLAPLTSRGKKLVKAIDELESKYIAEGKIVAVEHLHAAQEAFVGTVVTRNELERVHIISSIEDEYLTISSK